MTTNIEQRNDDWFLAQLDEAHPYMPDLLKWLDSVRNGGEQERADSLAELLQETLAGKQLEDEALLVLQVRANWQISNVAFIKACGDAAIACMDSTPENRAFVKNAGFDEGLPLTECFRRLGVLRALKPDVLCHDKTWGSGVIRRLDWFYKQVDIDFEKKVGHQLSFRYAAETLKILNEDHLLARLKTDSDAVAALVQNDPAEVIRIALRSFGPLPIVILQEELVPRVVSEANWKGFWSKARAALKKDPLVDVPTQRNKPLQLLDKPLGFDDAWFEKLASERNMKTIVQRFEALVASGDMDASNTHWLDIAADRLAFVIPGAEKRQPGLAMRAGMTARELGVPDSVFDVSELLRQQLTDRRLLEILKDLPARDARRFFEHARTCDTERTEQLLLELLPKFEMSALNEAVDFLIAHDRETDCAAVVRGLTDKQIASVEILCRLFQHQDLLRKWELGRLPDLARWSLRALENEYNGEHLRARNRLADIFSSKKWLEPMLAEMSAAERRELARMVKDSIGWPLLEKRSLMGSIVKLYPELQAIITGQKSGKVTSEQTVGRQLTSLRSYQERQEHLEQITRIEIPEVAKEIGVAREYGDLSENFEYTAAKDKQAQLLKRQSELQAMLIKVHSTDFVGFPHEVAGIGAGVVMKFADGRTEQQFILGVWDRDEVLNIISCESRLAQTLKGHGVNDKLTVPSEDGEVECEIVEITGLSEAVQEWIKVKDHS